jgi:DNA-binding transcriptional regulator YiaG
MSDILHSVHKAAEGFKKAGVIDKNTMRQFDTLCSVTKSQSQSKEKAKQEAQR